MSSEVPNPIETLERHSIQLGVGFKPYENITHFYQPEEDPDNFEIPEAYDHYIYLRRPISLHGINGNIDVISDSPKSIMEMWVAQSAGYRCFWDEPFGHVERVTAFRDGKLEPTSVPALLRFSFSLTYPAQYANLLRTFGTVGLGEDNFLLSFNLDEVGIKEGLRQLDNNEPLLVTEKNLFNMKTLDEIAQSWDPEDQGEVDPMHKEDEAKEFPGKITWVDLPVDLSTFQTIDITFYRFDGFDESHYPTTPTQPNKKPIPVFA